MLTATRVDQALEGYAMSDLLPCVSACYEARRSLCKGTNTFHGAWDILLSSEYDERAQWLGWLLCRVGLRAPAIRACARFALDACEITPADRQSLKACVKWRKGGAVPVLDYLGLENVFVSDREGAAAEMNSVVDSLLCGSKVGYTEAVSKFMVYLLKESPRYPIIVMKFMKCITLEGYGTVDTKPFWERLGWMPEAVASAHAAQKETER